MNKSQLIEAIANGSGVTKAAARRVLDMFIETVTDALRSGDQIVLPGFGSFSIGQRSARKGRNPRTGAEIKIGPSKVARFRAGKALKDAVKQ